jgi:hypothetical protein
MTHTHLQKFKNRWTQYSKRLTKWGLQDQPVIEAIIEWRRGRTHLKSTTKVVLTGSGSRRDHLNILMRGEISLLVRSGGRLIIITLRRGSALFGVVFPARECFEVIGLVDVSAIHVKATNSLILNLPRRACDDGDILMVVLRGPLHNTVSVGRSVADERI